MVRSSTILLASCLAIIGVGHDSAKAEAPLYATAKDSLEALHKRRAQLLEIVREAPLIMESNSSEPSIGPYRVIGETGKELLCSARPVQNSAVESDKSSTDRQVSSNAASKGQSGAGAPVQSDSAHADELDSLERRTQLQLLQGICTTRTLGYWTYEWCHRTEIRQYHTDADGSITGKTVLGLFDSSTVPNLQTYFSTPATDAVIDYYTGGDVCDVAGGKTVERAVEVHLQCCAPGGSNRVTGTTKKTSKNSGGDRPVIQSIQEHRTCSYVVQVCVPQLCKTDAVDPKLKEMTSAVEIVQSLKEGSCLQHSEGWWTYEVCHHDKVRQLHAETVAVENAPDPKDKDAKTGKTISKSVVQRVTQSFVLGTHEEATAAKTKPELRKELSMDPDIPSAFVSELFTAGDFCGKAGQRRSIEVRYTCMPDAQDEPRSSEIVSIEEERTCHYIMLIHLNELCHLSEFHKARLSQYDISCVEAAA